MEALLHSSRTKDQAVVFLENRTKIGDDIQYDSGQNNWVERGQNEEVKRRRLIWADANAEMEELAQAIQNYQEKVLKKQDARNARTVRWSEAMKEVKAAVRRYEDVPRTGPRGYIKRGLRKLQSGGKIMEHWCKLLPEGDYGGSIAGVFSMVATTATRTGEVRECIFEAIEDVPDYINATGDYLEIYEYNHLEELEEKSAELCKAILILFKLIMEYLTGSSEKRAIKAFLKGGSYEERLEQSKKDVERLAKKIRRVAQVCQSKRISQILDHTRELVASTKRNGENMTRIEMMLKDGDVRLTDLGKCFQALLESSSNFNVKTGQARVQDIPDESPVAGLLEDARAPEARVNRNSIIKLLRFNYEEVQEDLEECANLQGSLGLRAQDESSWVVQQEELRIWLTLPESRDLLIIGNRTDAALDDVSPPSLVCAELVRLCSISKDTIVVTHFCGLHSDYDRDERAGFAGMLASLIGQIIHQSKTKNFDLNLSSVDEVRRKIRDLDLKCLCDVFEDLVHQIPKGKIIYCIIDGISLYETWEYGYENDDAITVLETLFGLVDEADGKKFASVKLLLTCPGDSMNIGNPDDGFPVEARETLVVPENVDGDRQGAWETEELEESIVSSRHKKR